MRGAAGTSHSLHGVWEEVLWRLAIHVLLVGGDLKQREKCKGVDVFKLVGPKHRTAAVGCPVAAEFAVLNELRNIGAAQASKESNEQ